MSKLFKLVLQIPTTLKLAYVALGGGHLAPLDEESLFNFCLLVIL